MLSQQIFLIVLLTFEFQNSFASRSSYGEECSKTRKCDRKAWLSCNEGVCDCSRPEEMHYDVEIGKCVTKSGERCKYGVDESEENSLVEVTFCVPNSECGEDGLCVCDSKYHEIFNGTCELSKSVGESCSEEEKCSKYEQLHCIDGVCSCIEEMSQYSTTEGQCVGSLNQSCINRKCLAGAECKNGKCLCDIDHYDNSTTKTCSLRKRVKEACSSDSECIHKGLFMLKCLKGICECEEGFKYSKVKKNEYSYNINYGNLRIGMVGHATEVCAPLIGKRCPDGYCVPNAECKMSESRRNEVLRQYRLDNRILHNSSFVFAESICECSNSKYSYAHKDKSGCGKRLMSGLWRNYNQDDRCKRNDECLNNLVCYQAVCICPSRKHQIINSDNEFCISKIGGPCTINSDCVPDSVCKLLSNTTTTGRCHCKEGYVVNKDLACEVSHGNICDLLDDKCDKAANLVCIDEKCSCDDPLMYKYFPNIRKCLGLVGAECKGANSCIPNAECHSEVAYVHSFPSMCRCKEAYKETPNFNCLFGL